jgi:hypothetical protein
MAWARFFGRCAFWLAAFVALAYLSDLVIWRIRVAAGGGIGHVTMGLMQVAPLKGNKEEYYYDGTKVVDCSQSLFPQTGAGPCWWVQQHRVEFER